MNYTPLENREMVLNMLRSNGFLNPHRLTMKITKRTLAYFCSAVAVLCGSRALANPVLDQSQTAFNTGMPVIPYAAQSFTAGLSGELTDVDVAANGSNPTGSSGTFNLTLYSGDGVVGTNLGSLIQAYTIPFGYTGNPLLYAVDIDVSSLGVDVVSGSQYTFEITATGVLPNGFLADTSNPYAGGQIYAPEYGNQPNWDLMFQTYVDQSVSGPSVPDSAPTWALLGLAVVALAGFQRKRSLCAR